MYTVVDFDCNDQHISYISLLWSNQFYEIVNIYNLIIKNHLKNIYLNFKNLKFKKRMLLLIGYFDFFLKLKNIILKNNIQKQQI